MSALDSQEQLKNRILACSACSLREKVNSPTPFHGPVPADIAVIGEAPGHTEEREGKGFIGQSGQLLRRKLRANGIDDKSCLWSNVVACNPKGEPTRESISACKPNLWDPLYLAKPSLIILVGKFAYNMLGTNLKISEAHGRPHYWDATFPINGRTLTWADEVIFYPIYHPAATLRRPSLIEKFDADLEHLFTRISPLNWLEDCVICHQEATSFDHFVVGYCDDHKYMRARKPEKEKVGEQEELFI